MKLNQDNKKEIMTLGVPVLGLTYNTNQKKAVVADYFNPEFIIYNVTEEPLQFNLDRVIGNDLSVPYDGGEHKNLWNKIAQSHTHPRAQEAKLVRSKLFYLQNGGVDLKILDLNSNETNLIEGETCKQIHYFDILPKGKVVTLEGDVNKEWDINLYKIEERLEALRINESNSLNDLFGVSGDSIDSIYGLCKTGDQLLMITDKRSKAEQGVYSLDISNGLEKAIVEDKAMRIPGSEGMSGNGLAVIGDNLVISQYNFDRSKVNMGNPSKIIAVPFEKDD